VGEIFKYDAYLRKIYNYVISNRPTGLCYLMDILYTTVSAATYSVMNIFPVG
jgi:hypothetical protein